MNPEELKDFWNWFTDTYGWYTAASYKFTLGQDSEGGVLQVPTPPDTDQYLIFWRTTVKEPVPAILEETRRIDKTNAFDIIGIESSTTLTGDVTRGYAERIADMFETLVYDGLQTPDQAEQKLSEINQHIDAYSRGQLTLEQLPFFGDLTNPRFNDWFKYYEGTVKKQAADTLKEAQDAAEEATVVQQERLDVEHAQVVEEHRKRVETQRLVAEQRQRELVSKTNREAQRSAIRGQALAHEQQPQTQLPPIPDPQATLDAALQGMSPNLQRFAERQFRDIASQIGGARAAWWQALNAPQQRTAAQELAIIRGELPGAQQAAGRARADLFGRITDVDPSTIGEVSPIPELSKLSGFELADAINVLFGNQGDTQQMLDLQAIRAPETLGRKPTEFEARLGEDEQRRPERAPDPLATALQKFPFYEKFITQPRRQRGFFPGTSSPRARWFV